MRLPAQTTSSWGYIEFACYTWSSLVAWSEFPALSQEERDVLARLAADLKGHIDRLLEEARTTETQRLFARPTARARQHAWLALLKRTFTEAQSLVSFRLGGNSTDHPLVREFLPRLQATIFRKKLGERAHEADKATARLEGLRGDFPEKAALVERLRVATVGTHSAVATHEAALKTWSVMRSGEVVAKRRLRLALEKTHRALGMHFVGQHDFVESFFPRAESEREESGEEGGAAGEVATRSDAEATAGVSASLVTSSGAAEAGTSTWSAEP
ncbi:hypothetical protein [Chondromyces crocatus]|uniref:Uncharacterized protein n=1 Tax=Chondromyces crocatus TaxID=52 RepID=A0A0K1EHB4_CHOCO|nr:hypothetical protein [Chondromyces crocatus]AKT40244.1 uncharacterized protein CMC5_043970 [Chondromyces crocatus]